MIITKDNYDIRYFLESKLIAETENWKNKDGDHRNKHLDFAMNNAMIDGEILEFGVFSGHTINIISEKFHSHTIHGFDSFEGLPESWFMTQKEQEKGRAKRKKGHFSVTELPAVNSNVRLWKGWFDKTIPEYLDEISPLQIKFLHVDSDLYSSAKTIFDSLNSLIVKGTVIVFDEFYAFGGKGVYELWEEHEYKALKEWQDKFGREFEILAHSKHQQCCIKITK